MFDIFSWQHIIILLVVALVVVGPKDLPRLMNMAGKWAGKARAMASEFRKSFDEMARQAELDELRKEIEALKKNNPVAEMQASLDEMQADISRTAQAPADSTAHVEAVPPLDAMPPVEDVVEPRSGEFVVTDAPTEAVPDAPADHKPATSA